MVRKRWGCGVDAVILHFDDIFNYFPQRTTQGVRILHMRRHRLLGAASALVHKDVSTSRNTYLSDMPAQRLSLQSGADSRFGGMRTDEQSSSNIRKLCLLYIIDPLFAANRARCA